MKRTAFFLSIIALFFACGKGKQASDFTEDESGFAIKHCRTVSKSPKTQEGDIIVGELQIRLNDSTVLHSNYGSAERLFKINKAQSGTIDRYLLDLHIGDSVIIKTPAHYLENNMVGMKFRPSDKLYFYLTVSQIITQKQLTEHELMLAAKDKEEEQRILDFVKSKYPDAQQQSSGIYIDITKRTEGKAAVSGSMVKVYYSVCDLEGRVYDTNIKSVARKAGIQNDQKQYEPFIFTVGSGETIAGFSEGVSLMREGEKATIIIPSKLGYGEEQNGPIEPFTTLIFSVELLNVQ
ncbi:MAG: FKBP-type peptidyl-prolyl cis-trans isomerase [Bacteroidales bacterium]|jgi:FKBP-type peptidyl-prolyl cis-trans isomerase|nr:FKBP-type peptidyl-prolyl cis-trans isomerase [Bacteroidales bacterium]